MGTFFKALLGTFAYAPPAWIERVGRRRIAWMVGGVGLGAALVGGGYYAYQQLPKPLRVGVQVEAPGITPIVDDELKPMPVRLLFDYLPNPDVEPAGPLSAARLDLAGNIVETGIDMQPAMPGRWRFETDNHLVFEPSEDWPAGRTFTVRLDPDLFAANVTLASAQVTFETPAFDATVASATFYQHPQQADERRVVVGLRFTHAVSRDELAKRLALTTLREGDESALEYRIEYGAHDRSAHLHSVSLPIPERSYYATLAVAEGVAPAAGDGAIDEALQARVQVPDRTSFFRVDAVHALLVEDDAAHDVQTAVFTFTDQVRTGAFAERVAAWLLPVDRVDRGTTSRDHQWRSPREVSAQILAGAERLPVAVNPTERDTAATQSITLDVPEDRFVYLRIGAGLESAGGFLMASPYDAVVRAPRYRKEASIAQDGAVLPLTGTRRLTLSARGVPAIKVDIQQLLPDTVNHLASQTGGDIRDPWFHNGWSFNADNIAKLTTRIVDLKPEHPSEPTFAALDLTPFLADGGLFIVTVQGWNREHERTVGAADRRLALVTDLGLLVKTNADRSQHVFVHSIASGEPLADASVALLGKNGLPVRQANTDARGHARLPSASDLKRDQQPVVFVVRHGTDATFMPYRRNDRRLRWQGFDVGGEQTHADHAQRLLAALYTDRGLYRPGETVRLFGIARRGDLQAVPDTPLEFRITDPRGNTALEQRDATPADGLLEWRLDTRPESPTGEYNASVYLVEEDDRRRVLGSTSFDVADYRPDQLRIQAKIENGPAQGWVAPGKHVAQVTLNNLFGTPAQNRRVRGSVELVPTTPHFASYANFIFSDPFRDPDASRRTVTTPLDDTVTDADGIARLPFDLGQYDNGIYRLRLTVEGFEADGGQGVQAVAGTLLSAAPALVGYKANGDLSFIAKEAPRNVRFVALAADASQTALADLEAVLLERRHVSALVKQSNGAFAYQSVLKETELSREPFAVPAQGADYALPTAAPGRFALHLVDAEGTVLSRVAFAVAGARNLAGNLERNAELDLKLDRVKYAPGEEIVMEITAPYAGTGLATIERDNVYAFAWFRSDTNTALTRIRVPEDLEGNAYVNVAFVRSIDAEEIFVSPLSYAVAPFAIDRSARRLGIELTAPPMVRPGEELALGYRTDRPSRLVLFAIDEGILQVAKYRTPNPLDAFLGKKALQVDTHQMADLILPDYNVFRRRAAPGGGLAARLIGANLNPFRRSSEPPVAFWSGIVEAGPKQRVHRLPIPDYFNGEIRVVAVGVAEAEAQARMGAAEQPVTVRGPMVLTPNLPLAVAPGDAFDVSVGVANNIEGSGPEAMVALGIAASAGLAVEGESEANLPIAEGGEGRAQFRIRAGAAPGGERLTLSARSSDETVQRGVSLSVRPATPFETSVTAGFSADAAEIDLPRRLHDAHASRRVVASASPLALADGLLAYLSKFPHLCAEQTVSKTFPQLGLLQASAFPLDRSAFQELFQTTLEQLRPRQDASGGFRFWLTSREAAAFPSVYIAHFLTDAHELGIAVPNDILDSALGYLRGVASRAFDDKDDLRTARTQAYAIYVLTRNGNVTTNFLTALAQGLEDRYANGWRGSMAAVYMAASHAMLRNDTQAERLIEGYQAGGSSDDDSDFDTRLGRDAQYVYLLARHFPRRAERLGELVPALVEPIFDQRFNTLSAAYTVLALGEVHRSLAVRGALTAPTIGARGPAGPLPITATGQAFMYAELPTTANGLTVEAGEAGGGVYYVVSESGFDVELPAVALASGIDVDRAYLDANDQPVSRARIGDELTVRLRVRSTQRQRLTNVAVTDLLPGGFEIVADSVQGRGIDYQDVREDRLVVYGAFERTPKEIRYRVKAMSPGDFVAPGAHAAAMYRRGVHGRSAAGRFVVDGN